ncbi:hypothetical protein J32TS6_22740 [Virgibacillus pantothenticus]|uniref:YwdI family protein n=1 Tax=Virgibacillus pantothenticus TaxID=1473 RepID=A0A0L0QSB9_VIRPA|nr:MULTISPECIES: YwdI family protein [Virgibacillus]API91870.1 hypothetical protein BKP57_08520 [Virgibacillus sp. 6R]KNE21491.1 hypothetical protein AFK71_07490 [Virgibacillus pantothenticus]MBS7430314.1 YwdI family protein [Virgibacillus sp. 19R1-5]MBU8567416.1 YwdI family protein [Virgibacillus pantothenticus]MBU8598997.1 YwdI family protein [Virgibacillus pantothenticus]
MAVTNTTVIKKMLEELHAAKSNAENEAILHQHVRHIRLLCDLLLNEPSKAVAEMQDKNQISMAEMKMMLGEKGAEKIKQQESRQQSKIDHEEANGDSLFDF